MTTATFEKEIEYEHGDYRMLLNGRCIGYASTYSQAEIELDRVAYDLLTHGDGASAMELGGPGGADLYADAFEDDATLPGCDALYCTNPITHTIDDNGSIYYLCCKHYPDIAGESCDCEAELAAIHAADPPFNDPAPSDAPGDNDSVPGDERPRCSSCGDPIEYPVLCPACQEDEPAYAVYDTDDIARLWATSRTLLTAKLARLSRTQLHAQAIAFAAWLDTQTHAGLSAASVLHIWETFIGHGGDPVEMIRRAA